MGAVRTGIKYAENVASVRVLIIPVAILSKLIEHLILPLNYFYDSNRMLNMSLGNDVGAWEGSYRVTSELFRRINFFNFSSLVEWSIFVGIIFNIVLIFCISKVESMDILQAIFALMCFGLCNIYIFNICKDIIQFSLFLICFVIICIDKIPNIVKILGCALVFYWESTFFRNYYIIMAAFTIGVYIIIWIVRKNKLKLNFKKLMLILAALYLMMYVFLNIARVTMPEEYNDILTCKRNTEFMTASSMIYDRIDFGTNINLYMLNYIINSVRMMFPIELLKGGVFYFPFLAFQVLLVYYMYKNIKNIHLIRDKNVIALSVFIAFFMGSVLFEPDFGSFARHEAAAFPIIILFALDNLSIIGKSVKKDNQEERVAVYE